MKGLRFIYQCGRITLYLTLILGAFLVLVTAGLILVSVKDLPQVPQPLGRIIDVPQTEVFAATGQRIITLGGREPVQLSFVSPHFLNAVVATEDHLFFEHHGINKLRTLKALYVTLFEPGRIQGASTITQQLAKNLFFSFEKTYLRKFRELLVAFQIEATSTKQEILHAYVNQIHFGAGAQGIERASQVFFGIPASKLTLSQAALLAGLPKSPTQYNPFRHYERALARRNFVLQRMVEVGEITTQEAADAMAIRPELAVRQADSRTGSYFVDALINRLVEKYGEEVVFHGGIKVYSTLDPELQTAAETAVTKGLEQLDAMMDIDSRDKDTPQAALVAIDTGSGAVKAMVGGRDYFKTEFNRAVQSRRQPGSGFKPFLYYCAFNELGFHPATLMEDRPVTIPVKGAPAWQPRNFERTFQGGIILKQALTHSINTIAAQLVEQTGPDCVIQTARSCGITSPLKEVYSIALGTSGVTPLEMASAFATFATNGVHHEPFMIWRVEDPFGRIIDEHIAQGKRVLDAATTFQVVDMMRSVVDEGSARSIRRLGFTRPAAGKTGTTDSFNDAWFTGFTPSLSVSVWTGFDREKKLAVRGGTGITGGRAAAPIWAEFMEQALKNEPERDFSIPAGIRFETVDTATGCAPDSDGGAQAVRVPLKDNQILCQGRIQ
ncbi:Membrane carboxypeptidase (penicillin-binding protein) [Desulforapulum autotrophicum HRM2]|uniref:Membrane carboxypeptidase (Penicillin-binding protein) n=1 Tax=Desulforapulum autotrophicum (strain ATCC 43914 / DSM 3382 / VKM B-1955 / HRM2) TaxID=177437 RepID=C0QG66_DESAH|nr:PBP1A family penicillin-binding protein [Desulforapulum autotrophicum]ACN17645.1 Membrane carboxypeptidase (penicillin-binding protein) [Desulforapulum autotrophicum HRM2]